jgi:putative transferase (TIGR04331 family)
MVMLAGYTENCIRFAANLGDELRRRLLVRLSPRETGWEQDARWRDKFCDVRVERGQISMHKLMMESRLLVYTYNSTGFLEALVAGIPFVAFWDCDVSRLRPEAGSSFENLYAVGILHRSPESAAHQVSMVWSNVDGWWKTPQVQSAIRQFSEKFCASPKQAHAKIRHLLKES